MYRQELKRVSPEALGMPSAEVKKFIERLENCGTEIHGFMLCRHGQIAAECWWAPYHKDMVHINHSLGKSYVVTGIAAAVTDGLLSVDDKIVDLFAKELEGYGIVPSDKMKRLKVKHLMSMTNGMSVHALPDGDFEYNYLSTDVDIEPGTTFMYNTAGSCMLGSIVQKVTGKTVKEYLNDRIFEKIGIEPEKIGWIQFKNGVDAVCGVSTTTENNLRLGLLYLNGGKWNGEQLIDPEFVKQASSIQADNSKTGPYEDERVGYGWQMWMCQKPGTYRFDGGQGQLAVMDPANDTIVAVHQAGSMPGNTGDVLQIINDFMNEDFFADVLPENEADLKALREYEKTRSFPKPETRQVPDSYKEWNGIYKVTEGAFHVNPELRPFDTVNVYQEFYKNPDADIKTMSIYFKDKNAMEFVVNNKFSFKINFDGSVSMENTGSEIPEYYLSVSNGYFEDENTLMLKIRYIQTCFTSFMKITKNGEELTVELNKTALHDAHPFIKCGGKATRIIK